MSPQRRTMKLGAFLPAPGHHVAAWWMLAHRDSSYRPRTATALSPPKPSPLFCMIRRSASTAWLGTQSIRHSGSVRL